MSSNPKRVGLIGLGAIGASVVQAWRSDPPPGHQLVAVCGRPGQAQALRDQAPDETLFVTQMDDLLASCPDIIVEAAGHGALETWGQACLEQGSDLYVLSVGALSDTNLRERLLETAARTGRHIKVPAGALAGFDGLLALARDGLETVRYTSTKPAQAWHGTPAAEAFDLEALTEATEIFNGNAAQAARLYPKNANLAAAVALAGLGFESTQVRLVADPAARGNIGLVEARGASSLLRIEVAGEASADNPKTSAIVGLSVLSSLTNAAAALQFV